MKIEEKANELIELRKELGEIELDVIGNYTLADAIREGSKVTEHCQDGWGNGANACALSAAVISAKSRGYV